MTAEQPGKRFWFKRGTKPGEQASYPVMDDTVEATKRVSTGEQGAEPVRSRTGDTAAGTASDLALDLANDRSALIRLCVYALDRARSPGVTERVEAGLADIGVLAVRPDGQRFDPAIHEAGGAVPTSDPALDGLVAETELVGFTDRGVILRVPVVTVYQLS